MTAGPPAAASAGPAPDLIIRASRVVTSAGVVPADVRIRDGRITAVTSTAGQVTHADDVSGPVEYIGDDEVLMPGLVDTHVHVNEPGRTDWEGFATATAAAAAGGVTTIIDMPLNSIPPTIDVACLDAKRAAADGQCAVDVGFWGGAVPSNAGDRPALHDAGVFGFKCFMVDSGVPEFPPLDDDGLAEAMLQVAELGSVLIIHAEDAASIAAAPVPSGTDYAGFLRSRPPAAEVAAIIKVLRLAAATGARVHVLHLSSADPVPLLSAAREFGARISAETCPHYLTLAAEQVGAGQTEFKCCPPIRGTGNRERLWAALESGAIDCIVSDHSPCPPELKDRAPRALPGGVPRGERAVPPGEGAGRLRGVVPPGQQGTGDFGRAWGGISSVQLGLPLIWTHARERGFGLADVARWMSASPASLAGLATKGAIAPGYDADLVAFAPDEHVVVTPDQLLTRHKLTPYAGQELSGAVRRTWLRGVPVLPGTPPRGILLNRSATATMNP